MDWSIRKHTDARTQLVGFVEVNNDPAEGVGQRVEEFLSMTVARGLNGVAHKTQQTWEILLDLHLHIKQAGEGKHKYCTTRNRQGGSYARARCEN